MTGSAVRGYAGREASQPGKANLQKQTATTRVHSPSLLYRKSSDNCVKLIAAAIGKINIIGKRIGRHRIEGVSPNGAREGEIHSGAWPLPPAKSAPPPNFGNAMKHLKRAENSKI
jgi:hypothetical protein